MAAWLESEVAVVAAAVAVEEVAAEAAEVAVAQHPPDPFQEARAQQPRRHAVHRTGTPRIPASSLREASPIALIRAPCLPSTIGFWLSRAITIC